MNDVAKGPWYLKLKYQGVDVHGHTRETSIALAGWGCQYWKGGFRGNPDNSLEPISKKRLGFLARREAVKKRSIHGVCEHFEPVHNAARGA